MELLRIHAVGVQEAQDLGVSRVIEILAQRLLYVIGVTILYWLVVCVGLRTMCANVVVYVLHATLHVAMLAPACVEGAVQRVCLQACSVVVVRQWPIVPWSASAETGKVISRCALCCKMLF